MFTIKKPINVEVVVLMLLIVAFLVLMTSITWVCHDVASDNNIKTRGIWNQCLQSHTPAECRVAIEP